MLCYCDLDFIICKTSVKLYREKEGRATAKSSGGIQNQERANGAVGKCEDVKLAQCRDGRAGEREELDLCPEEVGLAAGFPQGSGAAAARRRKRMLGACQGQQLVGGEKARGQHSLPKSSVQICG